MRRITCSRMWRAFVSSTIGLALALSVNSAVHAQERVIGYEFGCVDWNADQGCTEYSACTVYDNGTYNCQSYYRGRDF